MWTYKMFRKIQKKLENVRGIDFCLFISEWHKKCGISAIEFVFWFITNWNVNHVCQNDCVFRSKYVALMISMKQKMAFALIGYMVLRLWMEATYLFLIFFLISRYPSLCLLKFYQKKNSFIKKKVQTWRTQDIQLNILIIFFCFSF